MEKANAVIERLCIFEADFKLQKQEFKDKHNIDPIRHPQLDSQINEWSRIIMISFKFVLGQVLGYFADDNEEVNGYAKKVVEKLVDNLVGNPEENLSNLLTVTEEEEESNLPDVGGLANLREVKVEEVDQNSTEVVLSSNSDNHDLNQPLSSSHPTNQGSTDLALSPLDSTQTPSVNQLVTPVLQQQNVNNVIQQSADPKKKRTTWKKLSIQPSRCMVKGCGKAFDYERIRSKHINKHHKKTRNWPCAKCAQQFPDYSQLSDHYFREHLDQFQCTFPDCGFTSKTARQVSQHFEEEHNDVSDFVNNSEGDHTNPDTDGVADHNDANDDDVTVHKTNSEDNVQPINQGSTGSLQSSVASNDDSNIGPVNVVQKPSTRAEPKTLKRTSPEPGNNEECNQVAVTSQGPVGIVDDKDQSSASVKKTKFDEPKKTCNPQKFPKFKIIRESLRGCCPKREAAHCLIYDDIKNANQMFFISRELTIVNRTGFKCFHCPGLFNTVEDLNRHKWNGHSSRAFPCLIKDCGQSFDTKSLRLQHTVNNHGYTVSRFNKVRVHCAKCPQDFLKYGDLTEHYLIEHLAQYECASRNCKFTSDLVDPIIQHYLKEHFPLKIVNTPEYNKLITQYGDLSKHLSNSEENVQPINQDSTGVLQSHVTLKQ